MSGFGWWTSSTCIDVLEKTQHTATWRSWVEASTRLVNFVPLLINAISVLLEFTAMRADVRLRCGAGLTKW